MVEAKLIKPAVIIVGSGRCGTSTIARLCHEELGIYMGKFLKPSDSANPEGYYEDLISHALVRAMVAGDNGAYSPELYLHIMNNLNEGQLSWGVKDPWFLYLKPEQLKKLQPRVCINAYRGVEGTVASWIKLWQGRYTTAKVPQEVVNHYTKLTVERQNLASALQQIWPNIVTIDFTEKVTDEEIKSIVRYGISSASYLK